MKKLLLSFAVAFIFASCNNEFSMVQQKQLADATSAAPKNDSCSQQVVFNLKAIEDRSAFVNACGTYFVTPKPATTGIDCSDDIEYLNVMGFLQGEDDYKKTKFAAVLKEFGNAVCYPISDEEIKCAHAITYKPAVAILNSATPKGEVYFSEIAKKLKDKKGISDFRTEYYKCYVTLDLTLFNNVSIDVLDDYDPGEHCFSLPLLRILVDNYGTNGELKFSLLKADVLGKKKLYIAVINKTTLKKEYYNFSQIPNLAPGQHDFYNFSPL